MIEIRDESAWAVSRSAEQKGNERDEACRKKPVRRESLKGAWY